VEDGRFGQKLRQHRTVAGCTEDDEPDGGRDRDERGATAHRSAVSIGRSRLGLLRRPLVRLNDRLTSAEQGDVVSRGCGPGRARGPRWVQLSTRSSRSPTLLRRTPLQCGSRSEAVPGPEYPKPLLAITDTSTTCRHRAGRASNDGSAVSTGRSQAADTAVSRTHSQPDLSVARQARRRLAQATVERSTDTPQTVLKAVEGCGASLNGPTSTGA
jgi:hypothetical protein